MGGNALKKYGVETDRMNVDQYKALIAKLTEGIGDIVDLFEIPYIRSKESFGDLDILYIANPGLNIAEEIKKRFSPNAIHRNGDVISFDLDGHQVDMIKTNLSTVTYSQHYFSYNDVVGNLVGKIVHKFGLKHGHDGLWLPIRESDNVVASILVSQNCGEVCDFLDLDYNALQNGFDTLEEAFVWLSNSRYFDPDAYKLENLNTIARVRDRKRTTYNTFLKWCEKFDRSTKTEKFHKDKTLYLDSIFNNFSPGVRHEYLHEMKKIAVHRACKQKFSGHVIMELTGLEGKELGEFVYHVKNLPQFSAPRIFFADQKYINESILEAYSEYRKS